MPGARAGRLQVAAAVVLALSIGMLAVQTTAFLALAAPITLGALALVGLVKIVFPASDPTTRRRMMVWTMLAFLGHLTLALAISRIKPIVMWLGPDSVLYHRAAVDMVDHWTRGVPAQTLPAGKDGFYYLLATLYYWLGPHLEAGLVVNSVMAAALVPLMTDATSRLFGPEAGRYVPPVALFFPPILIYTALLLREAGVLFLMAVAINCAVRLNERLRLGSFVTMVAALLLLLTFRVHVALIMIIGVAIALAVGTRVLRGVALAAVAFSLAIAVVALSGFGVRAYRFAVRDDPYGQASVSRAANVGGSSFAMEADVSTPRSALKYLPFGTTSVLLGPFPWQVQATRQLADLPDVLVLWCILPLLWRGIVAGTRRARRQVLVLLVPMVLMALEFGLALNNFGLITRMRAQLVLLYVPLVALGLALRRPGTAVHRRAPEPVIWPS